MKKLLLIVGGVLLVLIIGFFALNSYIYNEKQADEVDPSISSFEECIAAGYPSLDSYPEQCETADGRRFTRELGENELPPSVREHIASKSDLITVDTPLPFANVSSPLTISGEARGTWYFEASFPVSIEDANGNVLGVTPAQAQGEWMTESFVPFEVTLSFTTPSTETGTLVLEKANPSGLPEHADELRIPVRFAPTAEARTQTIQLYYYDPSEDEDASGNILCSAQGLVAVDREIPVTQTPIQDAIRLLISGELTPAEEASSITTEYPLDGFELVGASLRDGVLTLEFNDPQNATSGGSCRAGILWQQIRETAEQFDVVQEVRFQPEVLFQP